MFKFNDYMITNVALIFDLCPSLNALGKLGKQVQEAPRTSLTLVTQVLRLSIQTISQS